MACSGALSKSNYQRHRVSVEGNERTFSSPMTLIAWSYNSLLLAHTLALDRSRSSPLSNQKSTFLQTKTKIVDFSLGFILNQMSEIRVFSINRTAANR